MTGGGTRLAHGGRIDRSRPLACRFNGRGYSGFQGDTLASALLANGVHMVGRSFKFHRPRGIMSAGVEETNAVIQLNTGPHTEPNLRATQVELYEGLTARSVNAWPSVDLDLGAVSDRFSRVLVAGFYYKTFMHPRSFWERIYEPRIRQMAGLGTAPEAPDPDIYDRMSAHVDVLVVGAGPAGLAAALSAARAGARVVVADDQPEPGGALLGLKREIDGAPASRWIEAVTGELAAAPNVRLLPRTTAFGYYDHNYLCLVERRTDHLGPAAPRGVARQRLWHVRARQVVLATGAHERPLVFADNDRPGVMLASAVQTYMNRYAVLPGRRAVVVTNNDGAYEAALDLLDAGAEVVAVVDARAEAEGALPAAARERGIEVRTGSTIVATSGGKHVDAVEVMGRAGDGVAGEARRLGCDLVAMSGGWMPVVHLHCQSGGRLEYDEGASCFVPGDSPQQERPAGAMTGAFELGGCLAQGFAAGAAAAEAAGFGDGRGPPAPRVVEPDIGCGAPVWLLPGRAPLGRGRAKQFVDFQHDVTAADIALAAREGFLSVEHMKRYTTSGMGTDQGKTSNLNALSMLAATLDRPVPEVGTTTFRPPYSPVTFGVVAGRDVGALMDPERVTPMHSWHVEHGAMFEDVGQWKRPWYFPRDGEDMHAAVNRECLATRNALGVLDASTLGKIDIQGPDATRLLNRVYTNAWDKLEIGRCRYGLMCREDGMVFDDGVTTRLGENRYLMTTTTGGAAHVLDWLEEWLQTEWPELRVYCTSVTEEWATVSMAGPRAREVMAALAPDMPLDNESFPFMSMREGMVAGMPARVFRISFTGELSYEINVPSTYGLSLWRAVMEAGEPHGVTPYGTETMHVLRAEKGFVIVGQETDGTMTPLDLGMDWIVSKKKDFIGRRSLQRADTVRPDRKQLVGLLTDDPQQVLPEGAQLTLEPRSEPTVPMVGHVTSGYYSATLGRSIALAMVKGGRDLMDQTVYAPMPEKTATAKIASPVFYDPEGARRVG